MRSDSEKSSKELILKGTTVVPGIAIGRPFFLMSASFKISELTVPHEEIDHEIHRYYKALHRSQIEIHSLQEEAESERGGAEISSILKSHLEIIKDPTLTENVINTIRTNGKNAEYAVTAVVEEIEERINNTDSSFFAERIQDIQDVTGRIIGHLCRRERETLGKLDQNIIVLSEKLTPSDAACSNPAYIKAFVTQIGSATSHMAIVSRAKGIPYISGIDVELLHRLAEDSPLIIVDACAGTIVINPSMETLVLYREKGDFSVQLSRKNFSANGRVSKRLSLNLDSLEELSLVECSYPEIGIGLFRTEYIAIRNGKFPSQEEQVIIYKELVQRNALSPPVIRLFDCGGDKEIPGFDFKERALRLLFRDKSIFESQIKALLQAALFGKIKVLLPMVADITELRRVKEVIKMFMNMMSIGEKNLVLKHLKLGCMIEVPSAIFMIEELAAESDFFSIGTNDLSQYTLGVGRERGDEDYLNCALHPAILRIIARTAQVAETFGIPVSLCGEVASKPQFAPLFFGLGVKELSISPPALPVMTEVVESLDLNRSKVLASRALKTTTYSELMSVLSS